MEFAFDFSFYLSLCGEKNGYLLICNLQFKQFINYMRNQNDASSQDET